MRFDEAYAGWSRGRLTQAQAAQILVVSGAGLGVCERSFRRYLCRYEAQGLAGLMDRPFDSAQDKRLEQLSNRCAPVDDVMALAEQYRSRQTGWNVRHFHSCYQREGGTRSYTWVKKHVQQATLVPKPVLRFYVLSQGSDEALEVERAVVTHDRPGRTQELSGEHIVRGDGR